MKRRARYLSRRTNGELALLAGLSTAVVAVLVRGAPNVDHKELVVVGFAVAAVFGHRFLVRGGRSA